MPLIIVIQIVATCANYHEDLKVLIHPIVCFKVLLTPCFASHFIV